MLYGNNVIQNSLILRRIMYYNDILRNTKIIIHGTYKTHKQVSLLFICNDVLNNVFAVLIFNIR